MECETAPKKTVLPHFSMSRLRILYIVIQLSTCQAALEMSETICSWGLSPSISIQLEGHSPVMISLFVTLMDVLEHNFWLHTNLSPGE